MNLHYGDWYDAKILKEQISKITDKTFSIDSVFRKYARETPDSLFINSFGKKITWIDGHKKMNKLANSFMRLGIRKGDRVSILCCDSDAFVLTYLAVIRAGGVIVTLNTRLATSAAEIEYIVNNSESKIWVLEDKFTNLVSELPKGKLPHLKEIIVIGEQVPPDTISWNDLLNSGSEDDVVVKLSGEDQALQLYTSGTTGRPKGAMLTHYSCLAQMNQMSYTSRYKPVDRVQNMLPFPHCGFICFALSAFYAGGALNIIFPFEPKKCAEFVAEQKTTVLVLVPAMTIALISLSNISEYDFSSLRMIMYGGAPMPYATIKKMKEMWPQLKLQNIFGMTECSAAITAMKDEHALSKIAGVGKAVPGGNIRVVDEDDKDVPPGEVGEIIYSGPNVMAGYYKNPEGTAMANRGGWYHTGDLGVIDEDGVLKVVDRSKDMICRGGENVYPAEVERVLYDLYSVEECAVIGVPDTLLGERTKAFIKLKAEEEVSAGDVVTHCRKYLATFKLPEVIEFVNEIPKTPMSKLDKRKLRSLPRDNEWRSWEHK
jgi:long-chain acyl-CoA synthetase